MKILIVSLTGTHPERLLEDERFENVRSLMATGCYGYVDGSSEPNSDSFATIRSQIDAEGGRPVIISFPEEKDPWDSSRRVLENEEWDYLQIDMPLPDRDDRRVDEGLGRLVGLLNDDTVVIVVALSEASDPRRGGFVLASSSNPLIGEVEGVQLRDLRPTLLELAGYLVPDSEPGRSLVAGLVLDSRADDEEQWVRDRLRGLGYIA